MSSNKELKLASICEISRCDAFVVYRLIYAKKFYLTDEGYAVKYFLAYRVNRLDKNVVSETIVDGKLYKYSLEYVINDWDNRIKELLGVFV